MSSGSFQKFVSLASSALVWGCVCLLEHRVALGQSVLEDWRLIAQNGASDDLFGASVSIDGTWAIIGAYGDDDAGFSAGAAHIWYFDAATRQWTRTAKLLPEPESDEGYFGFSVAMSGGIAVVGAIYADDLGNDSGAAYVFDRENGWARTKLLAPDGGEGEYFGRSVSIDGGVLVIGSSSRTQGLEAGGAYVFRRNGHVWEFETKLGHETLEPGDQFGDSVCVSGDRVVVGAWGDDGVGRAYVYEHTVNGWGTPRVLAPDDGELDDRFGCSVDTSGNAIVVGSYGHEHDGNSAWAGSAYVFRHDGQDWRQQQELLRSDPAEADDFGQRVAIHDDTIVVNSYQDDDKGESSGSAYLFRYDGNGFWEQDPDKFLASDGAPFDLFSYSAVATDGRMVLIGAYENDNENGENAGAAYIYDLSEGITLVADGTCPGGGPIRIEWSGATLKGQVALIFATCEGEYLVPPRNPCQGTQLGLGPCQIRVGWIGRSDGTGSRVLNSNAGAGACDKFLQLLDLTSCATSNVATIE